MGYRKLSILCNSFNEVYCSIILPCFKYLLCFGAMINTVTSSQITKSELPAAKLLSIAFLFIAIYLYLLLVLSAKLISGLWQTSKQFIWNFRHTIIVPKPDQKIYKDCICRTLRPLRFGVGGLYYMEKRAKITLIHFLGRGTGKMFIAIND